MTGHNNVCVTAIQILVPCLNGSVFDALMDTIANSALVLMVMSDRSRVSVGTNECDVGHVYSADRNIPKNASVTAEFSINLST